MNVTQIDTIPECAQKLVERNEGELTMLWSQQVQTRGTIRNSKLDNIISDNKEETRMLLNVAISEDRNMIRKETEKILRYKDLTIEIQRMWNVNNESDITTTTTTTTTNNNNNNNSKGN